jgi:hypothetical protein
MNLGLKSKTISFIGLFFLASISLHSFAHIDEVPLIEGPELECLTCHYEVSSDVEVFVFIPKKIFPQLVDQRPSKDFSLQVNKPFNSQAPPKINI